MASHYVSQEVLHNLVFGPHRISNVLPASCQSPFVFHTVVSTTSGFASKLVSKLVSKIRSLGTSLGDYLLIRQYLHELRHFFAELLTIFINGVLHIFGHKLKAVEEHQKEDFRIAYLERNRRRASVKALQKPILIIPHSLRPDEAAV
jgi:hypothetical protein